MTNFRSQYTWIFGASLLTIGMTAGAIAPYFVSVPDSAMAAAPTNTSFPDTQNYWAQPFIQNLAERNIVTGYPDNTYRPEQPVDRDEFAAILHKAFSQSSERQIASGSVYKDVPQGNWAAPAIKAAYEMGFMKGYPGKEFRPHQSVTKVEVLVSLAQNLNLPTTTADNRQPVAASAMPAPAQVTPRRRTMKPLMFPLAITALMPPMMAMPAKASTAANPLPISSKTPQRPVSLAVSDYYQDAAQIPQYAVNDVAATTAAGIVVNYPDKRALNPIRPATRGEVAALIYQALVSQGKAAPIAEQAAVQYVVRER